MSPLHIQTPCIESAPLSENNKKKIYLKLEAVQPPGSFKIRGIGRLCIEEYGKGAKHFVCSSGGNAGLAVAYAARKLGVQSTVCVPETTSEMMRNKLKQEGANVVVHGKNWNATDPHARELANEKQTVYIPPFDHPSIWAGNATLIHEIEHKPDVVVVAVGGGGLFCGIVQGLHEKGWKDVPVITAETEGAPTLYTTVKEKKIVVLDQIDTIANSLGATRVCEQALKWTHDHEVIPKVVSDADTVDAVIRFANDHRLLVEPGCGAALSILYRHAKELEKYNNILIIVCGGAGINFSMIDQWKKLL